MFKRLFGNTNLALLLQGQFVTNLGNHLQDMAVLLWLKELTGSAALMGIALLLTNLPEAVFAPVGGRIADKIGSVKAMTVSDIIAGLAVSMVAVAIILGADTWLLVTLLCVSNIVVGLMSSCFIPASTALVPEVVSKDQLERGNAAHQFCGVGGRITGQAAGGLMFAALGAFGAMAINAVSYFTSAALESRIRIKAPSTQEKGEPFGSMLRNTVIMLRRTCRDAGMQRLLVFIAVFHLCLSVLPVSLPFYVEHVLQIQVSWFGLFVGSYTLGILLGFILAGFLSTDKGRFMIIATAGLTVGVLFGITSLVDVAWIVLPALIGIGGCIGVIIVNLMTELQILAPQEERAGIMGAAHAVGGSSLPIGMALTGIAIDILAFFGLSYGTAVQVLLGTSAVITVIAGIAALMINRRAAS